MHLLAGSLLLYLSRVSNNVTAVEKIEASVETRRGEYSSRHFVAFTGSGSLGKRGNRFTRWRSEVSLGCRWRKFGPVKVKKWRIIRCTCVLVMFMSGSVYLHSLWYVRVMDAFHTFSGPRSAAELANRKNSISRVRRVIEKLGCVRTYRVEHTCTSL